MCAFAFLETARRAPTTARTVLPSARTGEQPVCLASPCLLHGPPAGHFFSSAAFIHTFIATRGNPSRAYATRHTARTRSVRDTARPATERVTLSQWSDHSPSSFICWPAASRIHLAFSRWNVSSRRFV